VLGCVGIGAHVELTPIGAVPQRRPDLLAADHVLVAVQGRARAQRREVGTRFRLGHALTPDVVGADHAGEQLALLGIGAVLHDRRCDVVHPDHIERHRRSGVNRLLGVSELFEHAGPAAAVLLRPGHRAPARVGQCGVPRAKHFEGFRVAAASATGGHHHFGQVRCQPRTQLLAELFDLRWV